MWLGYLAMAIWLATYKLTALGLHVISPGYALGLHVMAPAKYACCTPLSPDTHLFFSHLRLSTALSLMLHTFSFLHVLLYL